MLRGSRSRTLVSVSLTGVLAGTLAAGCSVFDSPPEPGDAARALAAGLSTGDLGAVTFRGTTPAKATAFVKAAYKDVGTLRPQVSLSEMSHAEGSDRATATLVSRWDVSTSPTDWTYKTQVPMTLVDGRWQVSWTPGVVAPQLTADETLDVARKWPSAPTSSTPPAARS